MAKKEIDKKALNAEISKAMMNDFERVGMGFVTYWKLIACAAVGLAVLIAAICWAASYQRSSAKNAREALSGARTADELAAALQAALQPLNELLFCEVNPIPVKEMLTAMGWDCGGCRLPLCPPTEEHRQQIHAFLKSR